MSVHRPLSRLACLLLLALSPLAQAAEPGSLPKGNDFGAGLTLATPTPLAEIVADPGRFEGETVLLRGKVVDVCQKKGCWTMLRDGGEQVRIRFQDYGFFLPKDCVGAEAWAEGRVSVGDAEAREVLRAYGFSIPESRLAETPEEAVEIAEEIGYPVVLKIASPDILHKTDVGGVRLNLRSPDDVRDGFDLIVYRAGRYVPGARIWGCLVQQMVPVGRIDTDLKVMHILPLKT